MITHLEIIVRILYPGSMATMDFRPNRINLNVDDNGIINSVTMGVQLVA